MSKSLNSNFKWFLLLLLTKKNSYTNVLSFNALFVMAGNVKWCNEIDKFDQLQMFQKLFHRIEFIFLRTSKILRMRFLRFCFNVFVVLTSSEHDIKTKFTLLGRFDFVLSLRWLFRYSNCQIDLVWIKFENCNEKEFNMKWKINSFASNILVCVCVLYLLILWALRKKTYITLVSTSAHIYVNVSK